jgi:hypothetical protein
MLLTFLEEKSASEVCKMKTFPPPPSVPDEKIDRNITR